MIVLGDHQIFHSRQIGNQMELLKHHADFITPDLCQFVFGHFIQINAVKDNFPRSVFIHTADDIHQRGFS